jgi:hypothetical protein
MARYVIGLLTILLMAVPAMAAEKPVELPSLGEIPSKPLPVALPDEKKKPAPAKAAAEDEPTADPGMNELSAALLYDMCSEDNPASLSQCHAYLGGQWELMIWLGLGNFAICPPRQGITLEMLRQLVIRWLEKNHGAEALPRSEALIRAMRHYYGCPSASKKQR